MRYNSEMTIYEQMSLFAATGCGMQIGAYLLLSLFHKPLFSKWPEDIELLALYKLFYRFCLVIALLSGILAILAGARQSGFMLSILAMSQLLLLTHLLPAIVSANNQRLQTNSPNTRRSPAQSLKLLSRLQILAHFVQLLVLFYLVVRLSSAPTP